MVKAVQEAPPMSQEERNKAMMAFFSKGKKVKKLPTRVAKESVWLRWDSGEDKKGNWE